MPPCLRAQLRGGVLGQINRFLESLGFVPTHSPATDFLLPAKGYIFYESITGMFAIKTTKPQGN